MIVIIKKLYYKYKFNKGFKEFKKNGRTNTSAYGALRNLFVITKGTFNDKLSEKIAARVGKYKNLDLNGVLGFKTKEDFHIAIEEMKENGFYIFKNKLPEELIKDICNIGYQTKCNYLNPNNGKHAEEKIFFDEKNILSPRYDFSSSDIINYPSIQNLILDASLLAFAQEYLGVKPILDLIAFWWSAPFHGKGKSAAAQMYHFDLDRIKFLKFFFYLTDVDTDTGPHCYVKASHKTLPTEINRDGRFSDEEITSIYGDGNLIEICGLKGTMMAVDTRGFHKGKELLKDKRLLFQIEFANSMFGQYYPPIKIVYSDDLKENFSEKFAYTYKQILND